MKKALVFTFCFFLQIVCSFGQNSIVGKVVDKLTNEPLPGANIFVQSDWSIGVTSDSNGDFYLKTDNNKVIDTLIISYVGYKEYLLTVNRKDKKTYLVKLEINSHQIGETVVTARRIIAEEFTVKQMKQMDIYLNPAAKADPLLAINAMPASTTTDESASISLRGSRPDETGIFLNDVPVYDAIRFSQLNGIGTFSIFNTDIIERMHVFAGNPPLEFGNSASGLVSLQTKNNIPEGNQYTVSLSLANIGALTSQRLNDKTALVAFGNYQPSQVFTGLNQDAMKDLKDFQSYDLGFHIIHNVNPELRFKLFNYSNMEGYEFNSVIPSYSGIFDMNKKRNYTIANFISQYNNSEFTMNAGFNISQEKYQYSITDIAVDKQDVYFSSAYQHFYKKWSVKAGASFDYRKNDSNGSKPMYFYAQNTNHPTISFASNKEYMIPEGFLYVKLNLTDNLILGTGLRKNVVINHIPNYWSYQVNLNYKINQKHNFNLAAGHYNRMSMPNAEQYEITHFSSNQYTLDYTYTSDKVELQASVFKKKVWHSIFTDDIYGAELYYKFHLNPVEFQFSITSLDAQVENGVINYPSAYDLDYFIRTVLKYNLEKVFEISAIYIFRQGSYYLPVSGSIYDDFTQTYNPQYADWDNAERFPDYHKIDLSVSKYWVVNSKLAMVLYANVSNLLNTKNVMDKNYNYNYTESFNELYSQRTYYFGFSLLF